MAITASTFGTNRILKSVNPSSIFDDIKGGLSSAVSFFQGDLMCYDTGTTLVRKVAATGDAASFIGIADENVVSGKKVGPYTGLTLSDAAEGVSAVHGPVYDVIANMKLKSGDVLAFGAKVYLADGSDCQTVSVTDPGDHNYIGIYQGAAVTAGALSTGPVLLGARYGAEIGL